MDELDVEMHFPKEGVVLSRESRSSEKFMHGIKVLMAKNYIDNLSEEARKGMQEKAAPVISKLFELYATGQYSVREATMKVREWGLVTARAARRFRRARSMRSYAIGSIADSSNGTASSFKAPMRR